MPFPLYLCTRRDPGIDEQRVDTVAAAAGLDASDGDGADGGHRNVRRGNRRFDLVDIDLTAGLLNVTGQYGKKRLVLILPSTATALREFLRQSRELVTARTTGPFFVTFIGTRTSTRNVQKAFRTGPSALGLRARPGVPAPRLHEFHHTVPAMERRGVSVSRERAHMRQA